MMATRCQALQFFGRHEPPIFSSLFCARMDSSVGGGESMSKLTGPSGGGGWWWWWRMVVVVEDGGGGGGWWWWRMVVVVKGGGGGGW